MRAGDTRAREIERAADNEGKETRGNSEPAKRISHSPGSSSGGKQTKAFHDASSFDLVFRV